MVDMSPSAIAARLQLMSNLSEGLTDEQFVEARLDMSPAAITQRLCECSDLRDLCLDLRDAYRNGTVRR
jgi:hypothetical protein